ncbi:MAG: hypothetical protein AAF909_11070 [Pseudomonadota bacterium]
MSKRPKSQYSRPRRRQIGAALALMGAAALVTGCGAVRDVAGLNYDFLPESEGVAEAPWPRLADAPAPEPPLEMLRPDQDIPERRLGAEISADVAAEAEELRALAADLRAQPVIGEDLQAQAEAVRRRNAALDARDRRVAAGAGAPAGATGAGAPTSGAVGADEAARIRAEIEAELRAIRGEE